MKRLLALISLLGLGLFPAHAQQWFPGAQGIPIVCAYNATPPTFADGSFVYAQCSNNGTLAGGGGGGGGGAVTAALGSYVDGALITMGLTTDTVWSGSGAGTEIAILKKIVSNTSVFSGAVTIAAGADVSEGNITDTAWSGSGNSTVIAALKAAVGGINAGYDSGTNSTRITTVSPYPLTAVPITASATGTTAATTATLTNVTGHTTYICGYSVRANATAAVTVLDTVTGVITATMSSYLWVAPNTSGLGVDEQIFTPCIPASAISTSIAVVSGAPGGGGLVSVKAWGYSL